MNALLRTLGVYVVLTAILMAVGMVLDLIFGRRYIIMIAFMLISLAMCFGTMWFSKPLALSANRARIVTRAEEPRLY